MSRLKRLISDFPRHHLLIIIFFVLEGSNEFFLDVSLPESITLFGIFFFLAMTILFPCKLMVKDQDRAAVISFILVYVVLYCRTIYQYYSQLRGGINRITNTHFFLVLGFTMLLLIFLISKSSGESLKKFNRFLNLLFLTLILYTAGSILYKYLMPAKQLHLQRKDMPAFTRMTGPKNNIYLLLFDEYQGDDGLRDFYGTADIGPGKFLLQKGFYVPAHPQSNYNFTLYSLPSLLNMSYMDFNDGKLDFDLRRVIKSANSIDDKGPFISFLQKEGYHILNHSFFKICNVPSPHFLLMPHYGFTAIFSRTLPGWAQQDLLHSLPSNSLQKFFHTYFYQVYEYNKEVIDGMVKTLKEGPGTPKFVYAHLLIPHPPILTDSLGNLKNIRAAMYETNRPSASLKSSYATYIRYANSILEKMVTDIQEKDPLATIIFASDHGFRSIPDQQKNIFNNQCAVYIPGSHYEGFYDSVSLVNLLRLVLNNTCGQKFPLITDSRHQVK